MERRPLATDQELHCARHPSSVTYLRCASCNTPICPRCRVMTPVGAKCPDCAHVPLNPKFRFGVLDGLLTALICLIGGVVLGLLASVMLVFLGPLRDLLAIFFPTVAALALAEAIRKAMPVKRSVVVGVFLALGVLLAWIAMSLGDFAIHDPLGLANPVLFFQLVRNLGISSVLNPVEVLFIGLGIWIGIQRLGRL